MIGVVIGLVLITIMGVCCLVIVAIVLEGGAKRVDTLTDEQALLLEQLQRIGAELPGKSYEMSQIRVCVGLWMDGHRTGRAEAGDRALDRAHDIAVALEGEELETWSLWVARRELEELDL